jgi:hypothetical protein
MSKFAADSSHPFLTSIPAQFLAPRPTLHVGTTPSILPKGQSIWATLEGQCIIRLPQ